MFIAKQYTHRTALKSIIEEFKERIIYTKQSEISEDRAAIIQDLENQLSALEDLYKCLKN